MLPPVSGNAAGPNVEVNALQLLKVLMQPWFVPQLPLFGFEALPKLLV